MKTTRSKAFICVPIVLATFGLPGAAVAARTPELRGKTYFESTEPRAATVRLPDPVRISAAPFGNGLTEIRSESRIAGLVLKQDVPKNAIEIVALSVSMCPQPPCRGERLSFTLVWDPSSRGRDRHVTLPEGDYLVYLIAETPTRIALDLPGLNGSVAMPLSPTKAIDLIEPRTTWDPLPEHNVYSAEARQELEGIGWAVMAIEVQTDSKVYEEIGTCLQDTESDPVLQHVSVPLILDSCNGSGWGSTYVGASTDRERHLIVTLGSVEKGTYFHGLSYKTVGELIGINAVALDLAFPQGRRTGGVFAGFGSSDGLSRAVSLPGLK